MKANLCTLSPMLWSSLDKVNQATWSMVLLIAVNCQYLFLIYPPAFLCPEHVAPHSCHTGPGWGLLYASAVPPAQVQSALVCSAPGSSGWPCTRTGGWRGWTLGHGTQRLWWTVGRRAQLFQYTSGPHGCHSGPLHTSTHYHPVPGWSAAVGPEGWTPGLSGSLCIHTFAKLGAAHWNGARKTKLN